MARNIRIINIKNNPPGPDDEKKLNQEYVVLENQGDTKEKISGWKLIDRTPKMFKRHTYEFPEKVNGKTYTLAPGELAYIMTGSGEDEFKPVNSPNDKEKRAHFDFFQNSNWFIWNNSGDTAELHDTNGNLVASLSVP